MPDVFAMAKNQYKEKTPPGKKKATKKKGKAKTSFNLSKVKHFFGDERLHKIAGLALLLFSVYLFIAFTSFLFTWEVDQDKLSGSWSEFFFDQEIEVENWLGKTGAIISHQFVHRWFGIASYVFVLVSFIIGFKVLFKISLLPIGKTLKYSLFNLLWLSIAFGYLFEAPYDFMGGAFGYHVSDWLSSVVGSIGTGFLLIFSMFTFVVVAFNPKFDWLKQLFEKKVDEETIPEDEHEAINTIREEDVIEEEETPPVELAIEEPEEKDPPKEEEEHVVIDEGVVMPEEEVTSIETKKPEEEGEFSVEVAQEEEALSEGEINKKLEEFGEYDPKLDLASYKLPSIDLLENHGDNSISVDKDELEANKNRIIETLGNYSIKISKIKATIGPTVTLYEIVPAPGVRISKIKNLEDDIALSLAALGIRIIAPIPGKGTIGIEVPNSNPDIVSMRTLIASDKFQNSEMALPIALGKTISNETFITDLAKMPHLLMAGATGQGKSVGLNAILVSLLYKKHPSQIKFVLVDPKKVELTLFNKIERHFLAKLPDAEEPIITDTSKVVNTLNSLCVEMDNRYEMLKEAQVRNIKEYNAKFIARKLNPEKGHRYLPYIVLVVDEFADLIMTAGKEVETPIARLAQLARAIGIHLIIATQRPSVNIITGTIKANFPARIAFRVTSKIDSRTILDAGGADQLIGRGDMLLSTGSEIIRLQCGFVDTPEVDEITTYIGDQRGYPDAFILPEFIDESAGDSLSIDDDDRDALFEDAARVVVMHQQGSASLLQRKLKLGYNRAGRIVDQLEAAGIIGPFEGSKARKVLIPDEYSLEQFLNNQSSNEEN